MPTPVVVAYGRTPCCRARKGGLADMHPIDYAAQALKGVIAKLGPDFDPALIDINKDISTEWLLRTADSVDAVSFGA